MNTLPRNIVLLVFNTLVLVFLPCLFVIQIFDVVAKFNDTRLATEERIAENRNLALTTFFLLFVYIVHFCVAFKYKSVFLGKKTANQFGTLNKSRKVWHIILMAIWWTTWAVSTGLAWNLGLESFIIIFFLMGIFPIHMLLLFDYSKKNLLY